MCRCFRVYDVYSFRYAAVLLLVCRCFVVSVLCFSVVVSSFCCLYDVYSFWYVAVLLLVCWCFVVVYVWFAVYMMCTLFGMSLFCC